MADATSKFHRAASCQQRCGGGIAGVVMLALGAVLMALALGLEAPDGLLERTWGSVIGGAVLALWGVRSLVLFARHKTS
jgi:multisubunit Na+/H+ antiporter MnhB subunit